MSNSFNLEGAFVKHFKRQHFAIFPLLSILSLSPTMVQTKFPERGIASVQEEDKLHPKYEAFAAKVDSKLIVKDENLDVEKFKIRKEELKVKLASELEKLKKESADQNVVESLVVEILKIERGLKDLQDKKLTDASLEDESSKLIKESKDVLEKLISDIEENKTISQVEEPKIEEAIVAADVPKKEEKPVATDVKIEEPNKELCEVTEKNKALTAQVELLFQQQNQILQSMLSMTQMMLQMQIQRQSEQQMNQHIGMQFQNPYPYTQPSFNWGPMQYGLQGNQPNIFAQPSQAQLSQGGFYPDQIHQQFQPTWAQPSQNFFNEPYRNSQPMMPAFQAQSFNMSPMTIM